MLSHGRQKDRHTGVQRPLPTLSPEDPLHDRFAELTDFDLLLGVLQDASDALLDAASRFLAAPGPLLRHAENASFRASPVGKLLTHLPLSTHLSTFATRLEHARPLLEEMQQLVTQKRSLIAKACDAFITRDAAGIAKVQCEGRDLMDTLPVDGPNLEQDEGMRRASRRADEKFEGSTVRAVRAADAVLQQQRATIGVMLEKLCRYYAAAFESGQQLARDFTKMADSLSSLPCERLPQAEAQGRESWHPKSSLLCCLASNRPQSPVPGANEITRYSYPTEGLDIAHEPPKEEPQLQTNWNK